MNVLNPENEKLRKDLPKSISIEEILADILEKTKNIHVAYLFDTLSTGSQLLQSLSRYLCETKNSYNYSGWKELGFHLGLDPTLPKCIENWNIINEDPATTMLKTYSQEKDVTVDKIFQALHDLKRDDVILRCKVFVDNFYDEISKKHSIKENSEIVKPYKIPQVPLIFQNLKEIEERECNGETKPKTKKEYKKIVMLTYCTQDEMIAQHVAKELRKERNGQRIGVLTLNENAEIIFTEREKVILKLFTCAHYILPIISDDYLRALADNKTYSAIDNLDGAYAKYIYELMNEDYINNGYKNKRIRCIIPNDCYKKIQKNYFFKNPVFRTWTLLDDINKLSDKILNTNI